MRLTVGAGRNLAALAPLQLSELGAQAGDLTRRERPKRKELAIAVILLDLTIAQRSGHGISFLAETHRDETVIAAADLGVTYYAEMASACVLSGNR
jgi:hypothetical protein